MQSRHTWIPTLLFVETLPNTVPANSSKAAPLSGIWHAPYNCGRLWLELVTLDPFLRSWTCHGWEEPKAVAADLTFRCSALHFSFVFTIYKQRQEQCSSSRFCDDIPIIVSVQLRLCPEIFILWKEQVGGQLGIHLVAITTLIWGLKFHMDSREICRGVLEKVLGTVYFRKRQVGSRRMEGRKMWKPVLKTIADRLPSYTGLPIARISGQES